MIARLQLTIACLVLLLTLPMNSCAQGPDRNHLFNEVWSTINDNYFDPSFGGRDWAEIGQRYRPRAMAAAGDSAFYVSLNEMLFELGVSHMGVIPRAHPEWIGAPSLFSDGGIGAEARIVEGQIVVTSVRDDSPAEEAGLRSGYVIQKINGRTLAELQAEALAKPRPPLDDRALVTQKVLENVYGPAGTPVSIEVIGEDGAKFEKVIVRAERPGRSTFMEGIPPTFIEFEARRLDGGIGYISFNSFHPDLVDRILDAIDGMNDAPGLVIDLRGNAGGAFGVRRAIAERLVPERTLFWRYRRRNTTDEVYLNPAERVYKGPLAILTDCLSASSSEEFAGSLQAIGRATVVGEHTPGIVLVADVVQLRSGDTLVYASAQTITPDGRVLEGNGVVPDIEQHLTVSSLLRGEDIQLHSAIRHLRSPVAK